MLALAPLPAPAQQATKIRAVAQGDRQFRTAADRRDKGIFKEQNLEVTWNFISQGALGVEAVFGGSAEIAGNSVIEPLIARGNGLDVMYLINNTRIRPTPPDNSGIAVRTADPINGAEGPRRQAHLGRPDQRPELRPPEGMADPRRRRSGQRAVFRAAVPADDRRAAAEPARRGLERRAVRDLPAQERKRARDRLSVPGNVPNMDIAAFQVKESWVKANPDVARRLRTALERATNYLDNASKEERDEWIAKFTGVKLEVVKEIDLPLYVTEFNVSTLQANLDILVRQKLTKPFDVNAMI